MRWVCPCETFGWRFCRGLQHLWTLLIPSLLFVTFAAVLEGEFLVSLFLLYAQSLLEMGGKSP